MGNLMIKRTSFIKTSHTGVKPYKKYVFEKLADDAYRSYVFRWNNSSNSWDAVSGYGYFDGMEFHFGSTVTSTVGVDRKFELLMQYDGFSLVKDGENPEDTEADLIHASECSKRWAENIKTVGGYKNVISTSSN